MLDKCPALGYYYTIDSQPPRGKKMAYISQEKKSTIAPVVKAICKKYGVKASLAVRNHSTLVLNVKSGKIDFIENYNSANPVRFQRSGSDYKADGYIQVNPYWYHEHFDGVAREFLEEVLAAMNNGNHDNSNAQIDYFDVGWYTDVNIGRWNKSYVVEEK